MTVLVDTSVWIQHFRKNEAHLAALLNASAVLMNSFVFGELACGNLANREELLRHLRSLPITKEASRDEVLSFIERAKLWGRGVGLIDVHLMASCLLTDCRFWTLDKRLAETARLAGVKVFEP